MGLLMAIIFVLVCCLLAYGIGILAEKILSKLVNQRVGKLVGRATFVVLTGILLYFLYQDVTRFGLL